MAVCEKKDEVWRKIGPWILWRLWKSRNSYIFRGDDLDGLRLDVEEWRKCDDLKVETTSAVPVIRAAENGLHCRNHGSNIMLMGHGIKRKINACRVDSQRSMWNCHLEWSYRTPCIERIKLKH